MPKLAANLSTLFAEFPMEDRPSAAADAGFEAVEMRFLDAEPDVRFLEEIKARELEFVMFNASPGNFARGELGFASLPQDRARFEKSIHEDIERANRLGASFLHVMAGKRDKSQTEQQQQDAAIKAYAWAAGQAEKTGLTLLVEPLAPVAVADYSVPSLDCALRIVRAVDSAHFKVLFDFYHMQLAGGDIIGRFTEARPWIGHIQIAAAPSRGEPDTGELNVDFVLGELDRAGYSGWVGCEYIPKTTTLAGLSWAQNYLPEKEQHNMPLPNHSDSIAPGAQEHFQKTALLPSGTLIGRIWNAGEKGPSIVTVRDGMVLDITSREAPLVSDICEMDDPVAYVVSAPGKPVAGLEELLQTKSDDLDIDHLLAPCDLQAVKACGVTFAASMLERVIEEQAGGNPARAEAIRARVQTIIGESLRDLRAGSHEAAHVKSALIEEGMWSQYLEVGIGPDAEVFSKAQVLSSVGQGAKVGLHPSSSWNNPEPEIVLCVSSKARIVGATLGNDVNLRDIEGRSALLLSKAKDNNASCSIGPFIRLFDDEFTLDDMKRAELNLRVEGVDGYILDGSSSMTGISRDPEELVAQTIGAHHQYPDGLMLFLGTAFAPTQDRDIPGEGFTHKCGDRVTVSCKGLGELNNIVDLSTQCPPWTFGTRTLIANLARRGLI